MDHTIEDVALLHSTSWRWQTDLRISQRPAGLPPSVADREGTDLIVVGNKGMKGARRRLGSVPNSAAHRAHCSVLILSTT